MTLAGLLAWNGVVLLLIGDRAPSSSRTTSSSASPTTSCSTGTPGSWLVAGIALYAAMLFWRAAQRARKAACRPTRSRCCVAARRRRSRIASARSSSRRQPGPRHPVRAARDRRRCTSSGPSCSTARGSGATSTPSAATPRPRGAPASTSTASRSPCFAICSMMAALGGIVLASRLRSVDTNAGGGSILLYSIAARRHRRHVAVRRPRHVKSARARRARHRVDRQRPRPARPRARARSSSSPAACCCWR